jgi:FkbM family methyltransferase|tara:strand:+ start:551 stop:1258 length:708 start_codon:yes stop_codon:yes gene_type:complete
MKKELNKIKSSLNQLAKTNVIWKTVENNDIWALQVLKQKYNGVFIEAGAAGISNCLTLEKHFGWTGICLEPHSESFNELLTAKRQLPVNKCLYSYNGEVDFYECHDKQERLYYEQLSGIPDCIEPWWIDTVKDHGTLVKKECITLEQIIIDYNLPTTIDFLQMDIEGSELEVLTSFPFNKYTFLAMAIESGDRYKELLNKNNYTMVQNPFRGKSNLDHYFIHNSILKDYPYGVLQ